jgi:hypothetical protein
MSHVGNTRCPDPPGRSTRQDAKSLPVQAIGRPAWRLAHRTELALAQGVARFRRTTEFTRQQSPPIQ